MASPGDTRSQGCSSQTGAPPPPKSLHYSPWSPPTSRSSYARARHHHLRGNGYFFLIGSPIAQNKWDDDDAAGGDIKANHQLHDGGVHSDTPVVVRLWGCLAVFHRLSLKVLMDLTCEYRQVWRAAR